MQLRILAILTISLGVLPLPAAANEADDWVGPILKELGAHHGIQVGAVGTVNPWNPITQMSESEEFSDPDYVDFAELHFNLITSGQNYLNFNVWLRPSDIADPTTYIYLPDGLTHASIAQNFVIHGAHMIWHDALAPWMSTSQGFVAPDVETFMNHHIDNLRLRYPSITRWVVVNEAVKDSPVSTTSHVPGNLRDTIWKQEIGNDYIFKAFTRATQAGVTSRIYNDYNIYDPDAPKTQAVLQLVAALKAQGLIDGIGFQMHVSASVPVPAIEDLKANFEQFAALGVDVHVTEFDVLSCNTQQCRNVKAPAIAYNAAVACREVGACKSFSFWGLRNDLSWLHPSRVAPHMAPFSSLYPLPFDESYAPMPMFDAIVQAWDVPTPVGCEPSPQAGCRGTIQPGRSIVQLTNRAPDSRDRLLWKWAGEATTSLDFGLPLSSHALDFCIFDESDRLNPVVLMAATISPGGTCANNRPCWRQTGRGFKYVDRDLAADGVLKLDLRSGSDGSAKIVVKGKGENLDMPVLPAGLPLRVQVQGEHGECWEASYSATGAKKNDAAKLKAVSD